MKKVAFAVLGLSTLVTGAQAGVAYSSLLTSGISSYYAATGATAGTGATSLTRLLLDDVQMHPADAGKVIQSVTFGLVQNDPAAFKFRARIRFYNDNAGIPGTYIGGVSFNFGNVAQGIYNQPLALTSFGILTPASGKMWIGMVFDGDSSAAGTVPTAAQLNQLGIYSSTTVTKGFSNADIRRTNNPGSFVSVVPGPNSIINASDNSKLGYEVSVVPEPATMAALGLGIAALARRKRK